MKKYLLILLLLCSGCVLGVAPNNDKDAMKEIRQIKNYLDSTWHEAKKEVPDYKPKD